MTFLPRKTLFSSDGDYPSEAYDNSFLQDFFKRLPTITSHHITFIYSRCQGRSLRGQRPRSGEMTMTEMQFLH